jgi:hypothetical protein
MMTSPYLFVPLAAETGDGHVARPPRAVAEKRRLWLQDNAGMGKTVLMAHLAERFFADSALPSLFALIAALASCRSSLRPVSSSRSNPTTPTRSAGYRNSLAPPWRPTASPSAMPLCSGQSLPRGGRRHLGRGQRGRARQGTRAFAKKTPVVRMLVTSQPLLRLFLGDTRGDEVYDGVADAPLLGAIRSGYDVRLRVTISVTRAATLGSSPRAGS